MKKVITWVSDPCPFIGIWIKSFGSKVLDPVVLLDSIFYELNCFSSYSNTSHLSNNLSIISRLDPGSGSMIEMDPDPVKYYRTGSTAQVTNINRLNDVLVKREE